jgi:hypothetical protein
MPARRSAEPPLPPGPVRPAARREWLRCGPDMARALGFYRDLPGGQVTYSFPPDGDPGYVAVKIGTSHLGSMRRLGRE